MKVLCAMSGGVDSSATAALLIDAGHEVVGVTMKLWGGDSDTGCCSVSDVDDARRVADALGIDHHVFNFADDFEQHVVTPYVDEHSLGRTPNPCIECNRHLKFDRLLNRASALGFEAVATGHHAQIVRLQDGTLRVGRGADSAKDQSYVLYMLDQRQLERILLPVGQMQKSEVRALAAARSLRTADKPDSQDVCFITRQEGRASFLAERMTLTPGEVVDTSGKVVGQVTAVELVTPGQRKGLGMAGREEPAYAIDVDTSAARVTVGTAQQLASVGLRFEAPSWAHEPVEGPVAVQTRAHGETRSAVITGDTLIWGERSRRVAPGQSVVFYRDDQVLGGAVVAEVLI